MSLLTISVTAELPNLANHDHARYRPAERGDPGGRGAVATDHRRLRELASEAGVGYVGMDFDPGADNRVVNVQASLTRAASDASVGLMVCFHVLEHIPTTLQRWRDGAGARAGRRRGGPGAAPYKGVPTDEDPEAPVDERLRRFGQRDHVRLYGDDFEDRLRSAGLKVCPITMNELYRPIEADLLGIPLDEQLWLCTTGPAVDVEPLAEHCAVSARAAAVTVLDRLVADRDAAAADAEQLDQPVAKLRTEVERLRVRVRRAEKARDAAIAREKHLRNRPDVRVTSAVARRIKRLAGIPSSGECQGAPPARV